MTRVRPVALVTGASSGIGKAAALALVQAGFAVVGTSRNASGVSPRDGVTFLDLDVTRDESVTTAVRQVIERFGRLDVLVNNAGTGAVGAAEESSVAQDQRVFDINVFGLIRMTKAVLPSMRAQGSGRIINISSVLGLVPAPYMASYAATKHAVEGYSESLDHEVRQHGVRVLLVEPAVYPDRLRRERPAARRTVADLRGAAAGLRPRDGECDGRRRRSGQRRHDGRRGGDRPEANAAVHRRLDGPTRQRPAPLRSRLGVRPADPEAQSLARLKRGAMSGTYVHGYHPRESERLSDQAGTLVDLLHADTAYPAGSRVLEAGCGVGAQTVLLARRSPEARFTSVDVSADSIAEARRRVDLAGLTNVTFRRADLFALPFAAESFDHAFVCFVLEHLARPGEAVAILHRLLRPGGTITVIEGDHGSAYFHPDSPAARAAIRCQVELQRAAGGDALIGRRLYPLMVEAGVDAVRVSPRMVYVDASRPELVDGFTNKTFIAMIEGVRAPAIAAGLIESGALRRRRPRAPPHDRGGRGVLLHVLQGRGPEAARRPTRRSSRRAARVGRGPRRPRGAGWPARRPGRRASRWTVPEVRRLRVLGWPREPEVVPRSPAPRPPATRSSRGSAPGCTPSSPAGWRAPRPPTT